MVLADRPIGPGSRSTPTIICSASAGRLLASPKLAKSCRTGFPRSINGVPCLLPSGHATVRRELDQWFEAVKVRPALVAEFDDSALMYAFGEEGKGIFPSPTVFEEEFRRRYHVQVVGQ